MGLLGRRGCRIANPAAGACAAGLAALLLACGPARHQAEGVIEDVARAEGQVLVAHEEIPGVMPAMTMNFDVPSPELLARLEPGQVIDFTLEISEDGYRITDARVRDRVEPREGWARLGQRLFRADPAPAFAGVDQSGRPVSLASLRGRAVLLDFVFTRCPGPCPILTGLHVDVQRALPEPLRERVQLVSISLDPAHDTPERMREYARARGADLSGWSFVTGEPEAIDGVLQAYGIGKIPREDGDIDHVVATFLIDPKGRIVRRYLGLEHEPEELLRDLEDLLS